MSSGQRAWTESDFRQAVTSYCFGELQTGDLERFEQHLFECDQCWRELQRLEAAVRTLRTDHRIPAVSLDAETLAAVKLSSKVEGSFGGAWGFAISASVLYALLYVASVWTELAYAFDQFRTLTLTLTPTIFLFVLPATVSSVWSGIRIGRRNLRLVLPISLIGLFLTAALVLTVLAAVMPAEPTVRAGFSTRTPFSAYLRNVVQYFLPVGILYFLVPLHAVLRLEQEVHEGRSKNVVALLAGDRSAFQPAGLWFIRPRTLALILGATAIWAIVATNYLLDALTPGPYSGWFMTALYLRNLLWFGLASLGLAWYHRRLEDLKQLGHLTTRLRIGQ